MQKVKEILTGHKSDETSPRNSLSGSNTTAGYQTGDAAPASGEHSNMSKEWALGALGKDGNTTGSGLTSGGTNTHGTSGLTGSSTGSGLTGDQNIHSGSTNVGSNIGRNTNEISGGQGLGNAATAAGTHRTHDTSRDGLTGDRSHDSNLTSNSTRSTGLTGDRSHDSNLTGNNSTRSTGERIHDKISGNHTLGHDSRDTAKFDATGERTHHDHQHLAPVTHDTHRHIEVEEVERERNVDRHVHHLQHHVQPVKDQSIKDEVIHQNIQPVTKISEKHVNTDEDVKLFHGLGEKYRDTETHLGKERTVVDLGEKVNTTTHHHVHHVTQPVVEREVHDRHRIHTVVPLSHTVHEAPIIHKSSVHEPVHMSDFLKGGGKLDSSVRHSEAGVLSTGDCDRTVDGLGEKLVQDLNLKPSTFGTHGTTSSSATTGTTAGRTGISGQGSNITGDRTGHDSSIVGPNEGSRKTVNY